MLDAIARVSVELEDKKIDVVAERLILPWALAAAAKEAIISGNEFRDPGVSLHDIQEICGAFNAVVDPLLKDDAELGSPHSLFTRISYEQFPYQSSVYEEMTRAHVLFETCLRKIAPRLLGKDEFWRRAIGGSLIDFLAVGLLGWVGAQRNGGYFDLAWLEQPNFKEIVREVPAETVRDVFLRLFATTIPEFRELARANATDRDLPRFDFNPLNARPFIQMPDGRHLAPVPQLILRRASATALYYIALDAITNDSERDAFFSDLGDLFQAYVGMQLAELPGCAIQPEIEHDGGRSVDWFVIWPDLVLLVEAKSTRLTQAGRTGRPQLADELKRSLGKAFEQLARSMTLIKERHPAFAEIPSDRPMIGIAATLEPYYLANSHWSRELLGQQNSPTLTVSARGLERLVTIGQQHDLSKLLRDIEADPERRTWDLEQATRDIHVQGRNRLLDEAWAELPWKERVAGAASEAPTE